MLGYVKQELLAAEQQLRLAAEALAAERAGTVNSYRELVQDLREQLREASERHGQQLSAVLEHLAPKTREREPLPLTDALADMTPDEIRALPAHSRREMYLREQQAKAAERRLNEAKGEEEVKERRALLTPDERTGMEFDPLLGVDVPVQEVLTDK